jgi:hypothetical protein
VACGTINTIHYPADFTGTASTTACGSYRAEWAGTTTNGAAFDLINPFSVTGCTPTLTTTLSANSIVQGNSATDSATLSNAIVVTPTGTIKIFYYGTDSTCTNVVSTILTATVTGNKVYGPSSSVTPPTTGNFYFNAGLVRSISI